jgi:tRNA pseudouridine38-40 synthase
LASPFLFWRLKPGPDDLREEFLATDQSPHKATTRQVDTDKHRQKRNIRLILAYDGRRYHGWQRQRRGTPTIQGVLEEAIQKMTGEPATLIASGRTDAGVHALHQVCHFLTGTGIQPGGLRRGLNSIIPGDILIREAEYVPLDFHARYGARTKTYEYRILNRGDPDVFLRYYTWHIPGLLDLREIGECLRLLRGRHDFSSFRSTGSGNVNPVREMMRAECDVFQDDMICFLFEADGFLRHMVRNMVGTLVGVGRGKTDVHAFARILESRDRRTAGIKAPPQGLFLKMVRY